MSEIRLNPITGASVILSTERGDRPGAWTDGAERGGDPFCPFCPGNEASTPPEIERTGGDRWNTRVIPNKYPAIQASNGIPAHEVVIDIPDHDLAFEDLGQERLESAISVWQRRAGVQAALPARRFVCVFRNEGRGSGQSIAHPHSQIVALDHVPERIRRELEGFSSRPCPLCALIENECRSGKRMIDHSGSLVLIAPPASKAPFETWITSARHQAGWTEANPGQMAELLLSAVQRLRSVHPGAPFNLGLVTRPLRTEGAERFHWYAEVTPRLTNLAGFEMLTGEWINIESPERAAERLREALPLRRD